VTSPILALRAALLARLSGDAALAVLMGGTVQVYDEPPRGAVPVYALFGDAEARDDSVDGAGRYLLSQALAVVARPGSAGTALAAAARMAALLADLGPDLPGHVLIRLRIRSVSAARDERSGEARANLLIEAVAETA